MTAPYNVDRLDVLARALPGKEVSPARAVRTHAVADAAVSSSPAQFPLIHSRISACANPDGVVAALPAYPDDAGYGPAQPFLFLEKPLPAMRHEKPEDAARRLSFLRERGNALLAGVRSGRRFSPTQAPRARGSCRPSCAITFFDETLSDRKNTLLDSPPSGSAVHVQVFAPN